MHAIGINKSNFPDFHFKITYNYCTSSDRHPTPIPIPPSASLISRLALKRGGAYFKKEELFILNLKTDNCK